MKNEQIVPLKLSEEIHNKVAKAMEQMIPPSAKAPVFMMTSHFDTRNDNVIIALHFLTTGKDSLLKWTFSYSDFKEIFINNKKKINYETY